tara:strand:- start:2630 stop:2923 length:294 start_codon:yes stop_codon:yes gene_type:complete
VLVGDKIQAGLCVIERLDDDRSEIKAVRMYEVWLPDGYNGNTVHSLIAHGMEMARADADWHSDPDNLYQCVVGGGCGCGIDEGDDPVVETPVARAIS